MEEEKKSLNFLEQIIEEDLSSGRTTEVITRFPPEPNGYLHIGHAKSICLNFGLAKQYNGKCNLRFDDTNPVKEDVEYVDSIKEDIKWLGFDWEDREYYASDYFEQLYDWAVELIKKGKAYVCEMTHEQISEYRGTPTQPGKESPFRNRSVDENLDLFDRMKKGEFKNGEKMLRAKIDMTSTNMHMRDPILYRIIHTHHHRSGDKWCIYPMYDYAHGQSDFIEGVTNSFCTLEFEVHRPLYEWLLDNIAKEGVCRPQQREFARLNLTYTVMSKRKLLELVEAKNVTGWDDPRMPTISGLRRRGYTPASIRMFAEKIGVSKRENVIDVSLLEFCAREDLNKVAPRLMAVLDPIKVVITNFPEGKTELCEAIINPEDEHSEKKSVPFSREIYIDRSDFMEVPSKNYFRLAPNAEVRLKYAYFITCEKVIKNDTGEITELHCTYDPDTKSGTGTSTKKVKGTITWVPCKEAVETEIRLYDRLFNKENPLDDCNYLDNLNPDSLQIATALCEPWVKSASVGTTYQFERIGYFCVDKDTNSNKIVFNRTVTMKDSWAKQNK